MMIAKSHLKKDPILSTLIEKVPPFEKAVTSNYFYALVAAIISQQLSVKAADTIEARFKKLFPHEEISPQAVLEIDSQLVRDAGISWPKISYIKDLAEKTLSSGILFEQFEIMTDEEIIIELVKVKGIGRWTAEVFLMFAMERPDVFSYGDLGIRKAIQRWYKFDGEPTQQQAEEVAEKWKPYRTLACCYLWRSLELK